MPYDIQTKDGITIRNVPDNIDPNSDEIKQRVAKERQKLFTSPTVENEQLLTSGGNGAAPTWSDAPSSGASTGFVYFMRG